MDLGDDAATAFDFVAGPSSRPTVNVWTQLRRFVASPLGAALGGVLFAAWAALVNRDGGVYVSLRSSFGQFFVSSLLTMFDARLMDRLFHRFPNPRTGALMAAAGSLIGTYVLVIGVHGAIGTPHILLTILPGLPPTLGFTAMYTMLLLRENASSTVAVNHRN
jgi:hypothetical protein